LSNAADALQPDAIAWDAGWQGDAASARLAEAAPDVPILALVSDEEDARAVLGAGVAGVLRRDANATRIAAALLAIAQRLTVLDADFSRPPGRIRPPLAAPDPGLSPEEQPPLLEELTGRELEVLRLLAEGLPNKTIAQRLEISEHTVKFHVNSLLGKLGAGSRTEAVVRATRLGLILL
jgi:DNA-binding NarL/FixJ family response regulator